MSRLAIFLPFLAVLAGGNALGQSPQAMPLPVKTRYMAAQAFNGTNYSAWSNEISSTNRSLNLAWTPSPTPGTVTLIGSGWSPGNYTMTNCVGTNSTTWFPVPPIPLNTILSWGDYPLITNPPSPSYFSQYTTTNDGGAYVVINYSTNLVDWIVDWRMLPNNGGLFTFTQTP